MSRQRSPITVTRRCDACDAQGETTAVLLCEDCGSLFSLCFGARPRSSRSSRSSRFSYRVRDRSERRRDRSERRRASVCDGCGHDGPCLRYALCPSCCAQAAAVSLLWSGLSVEEHHLIGRAYDSQTAAIPRLLHRLLSDRQRHWPDDAERRPALACADVIERLLLPALDIARANLHALARRLRGE